MLKENVNGNEAVFYIAVTSRNSKHIYINIKSDKKLGKYHNLIVSEY